MTDNRSFEPIRTRFEDTWPNYSWAPLLKLVFACADWIQDWRQAKVASSTSDPASRVSR
jgi:hypothetical protein